jgi:eukaryotic-like serine/threonine-protein kinase
MNSSTCPECGATMKPGSTLCAACLLSAGNETLPLQPVSTGIPTLPCVFGGYRLMKKLGSGGMGIVYEAEEIASGRRLALKVLNQSLDNEEQRQRFLREGRLAATIDHPHSVYVFGTEEIDGVPVIAMELAEGGTLRDELKRRGTMPVRDAVDAILGVLDGLEAAHAKGILHRDMKPTNCFVTGDGHAIVGDYGLSVSQNQPVEDCLTQSGTIMGTPAFSPPEQLRGQPLDQRADIYSTAGTLYYLLTGKAPVEAGSPVETVAAVLEGRITPLTKLRADAPPDLAAVIIRCLSADAAKRPATHAEMRQALMPFSSIMPEPAPLGLRLLAGAVDLGILEVAVNALKAILAMWGNVDLWFDWSWAQVMLVGLPYFILLECLWGTTPGKVLCGLCVRRQQGGRPGIGAAALRAVLILGLPVIAGLLVQELRPLVMRTLMGPDSMLKTIVFQFVMALLAFAQTYTQLLLFIPVFRCSDHAGWHDILSGIRVVRRAKPSLRKRALPSASKPVSTTEERWGPFIPGTVISPDWRHGHDPVLKRPVLLQRRAEAAPTSQRRDCNRGGRLRWMQSVSDPAGATWDVWQSPAGTTLPALIENEPPAWSELLSWMQDLTHELDAAQKDQTLPPTLSLTQVWITTDGRAVLLDAPWPGTASHETTTEPQAFLHALGSLAVPEKRPLHADSLLQGLGSASFERLSHVAGNVTHLQQRRADVSHLMRAACLIGSLALPVFMIVVGMFASDSFSKATWDREYRGIPQLSKVLMLHDEISRPDHPDAHAREAVERHLIHQWSWLKQGDRIKSFQGITIKPQEEKTLLAILARKPAELEASVADEKVRQLLAARFFSPLGVDLRKALAPMVLLTLALIALLQLVSIVLCGSPLLMRLTGVAAVTLTQRPARRLRMLGRWIICWTLLWLPALVMSIRFLVTSHDPIRTLPEISLIWVPIVLLLAIIAFIPRRSLVDRLAGTWLVAR